MSFEPAAVATAPTNLSPANGTAFPEGTTTVTLSWSAVTGDGAYSVRVNDLTNPDLRHPGNNCPKNDRYVCRDGLTQTSLAIALKPGHAYSWSVYKGKGLAASARFRVGECDAAEFVKQVVPEIVAPGAQVSATITMRNSGSTTWTAAAGYKLGSQNPQDNVTWGTRRVLMPPGAQVLPGKNFTFSLTLPAPATPQTSHFQWRMVHEGAHWFGQRTVDRFVHVKARPDGGSRLKRDTATGLLRDAAAAPPVTLRGGHYYLFEKNSQGERKLVRKCPEAGTPPDYEKCPTIFKEYVDAPPCKPKTLPPSVALPWPADGWVYFFRVLADNDINLTRVFLTNGSGIVNEQESDLYPFHTVKKDGKLKWQVKLATERPTESASWNAPYFVRLKKFARAAAAAEGPVFLQLSLFNYYDLDPDAWDVSIWNPDRSDDRDWGLTHLVNPVADFPCSDARGGDAVGRRHCYFMEPPNARLLAVQEQFVRKVVRELAGLPNIILEVMNEPHRGSQESSSRFASRVVGWIIDEGEKLTPKWRPLISVNAARAGVGADDPDDFDVDWWAANQIAVPHYEDVDVVSFHGLTGYPSKTLKNPCDTGSDDPFTANESFYRVALEDIRSRCDTFRRKQSGKALMMSTDAVRVPSYYHTYGVNRMDLMEGQITTKLNRAAPYLEKLTRSDLEDWAYWCFAVARQRATVIHFQQHSIFESIYPRIKAGFGAPLAAEAAFEAAAETEVEAEE